MLSLHDDIAKFQKLVYNKELSEFITIDHMFAGGGITMESLIKENHFMVEELKKMGAVFLNFCKLNEKVYGKIMEHELNLHNESSRLNNIVASVDRKINESIKIMKELHEDTIQQNNKSRQGLEQITGPLREEMGKKVDNNTFVQKMKQILDQYDEGGAVMDQNGQIIYTGDTAAVGANGEVLGGARKRGKTAAVEQLQNMRKQLEEKLEAQEAKLEECNKNIGDSKDMLFKYILLINKNGEETHRHEKAIDQMELSFEEQNTAFLNFTHKITNELHSKTNETVWQSKFDAFHEKVVKTTADELQKNIAQNHKVTANSLNQLDLFNQSITSQMKQRQRRMKEQQKNIEVSSHKIEELGHQIAQSQDKSDGIQTFLLNEIESTKKSLGSMFESKSKGLEKDIAQINKTLSSLVTSIEESVLKAVSKKNEAQMKVIENDIKEVKHCIREINTQILNAYGQINSIKDVLSKKANFTDILLHFERKADKDDIKELKDRITETTNHISPNNVSQKMFTHTHAELSKRKTSLSKTSKTIMTPQATLRNNDSDTNTKLFMCGFDDQIPESRPIFSQNTRRRSMKSSLILNDVG